MARIRGWMRRKSLMNVRVTLRCACVCVCVCVCGWVNGREESRVEKKGNEGKEEGGRGDSWYKE